MLIKQARGPFIIYQLIACKSKRSLWRPKTTGKSSYLVGHCSRGLSVHCCADVCHLSRVPLQWSRQTNTLNKESICSSNLTSSRDDEGWMNHKGRIHTQKSHWSFTVILRQAAKCVRKWKRSEINVWYQKIKYMMNSYSWIVSAKRRGEEGRGRQAAFYG